MKTKVFETGAVCAAVALLFVLSLPAYAKSGGSTSAHTRVGKTPSNPLVKPVTSSRKAQSETTQKKVGTVAVKTKKEVDAIKQPLGKLEVKTKELTGEIQKIETKQSTEADRIKSQQDKSGSIQKNLEAEAEKRQEMNKAINCLANC
jgi:vacuolar-type H+-ATPase subunit I/STV1